MPVALSNLAKPHPVLVEEMEPRLKVRGSRQRPDPDDAVAAGGGQPGAARRCQNLSTI